MAYRDLGEFYRTIGDYQSSLKQYQKLRDVCTTSQHVLDMCLSVLEVCYIPIVSLNVESRNINSIATASD